MTNNVSKSALLRNPPNEPKHGHHISVKYNVVSVTNLKIAEIHPKSNNNTYGYTKYY